MHGQRPDDEIGEAGPPGAGLEALFLRLTWGRRRGDQEPT
jgi:hypothetical protein